MIGGKLARRAIAIFKKSAPQDPSNPTPEKLTRPSGQPEDRDTFANESLCWKCGYGSSSIIFHEDSCPPVQGRKRAFYDEHLHRKCERCGFEWDEIPCDFAEGEGL